VSGASRGSALGRAHHWERGRPVVVRSRPDGDVGYTFPAIVVKDAPELIALFQSAGTVCKQRGGERGGPRGRNLVSWDGTHNDVVFHGAAIHVHVPGDEFWVIRTWDGTGYVGWYINLASPWRRTQLGFDTDDRTLDIDVADDRSRWSWKDEDELAWRVEQGRLSAREADAIRRHGEDAVTRMYARTLPFVDDWSSLEPDPQWPLPVLPAGWDDPAG
jgi:Protein of unknown function (DUF402)